MKAAACATETPHIHTHECCKQSSLCDVSRMQHLFATSGLLMLLFLPAIGLNAYPYIWTSLWTHKNTPLHAVDGVRCYDYKTGQISLEGPLYIDTPVLSNSSSFCLSMSILEPVPITISPGLGLIAVAVSGMATGMLSTGFGGGSACPEDLEDVRAELIVTFSQQYGTPTATLNASLGPLSCCDVTDGCNSNSRKP